MLGTEARLSRANFGLWRNGGSSKRFAHFDRRHHSLPGRRKGFQLEVGHLPGAGVQRAERANHVILMIHERGHSTEAYAVILQESVVGKALVFRSIVHHRDLLTLDK